jgi:hypothetical protein
VTEFAPQKAPKLITCGKWTFNERVILRRVNRPVSPTMKMVTEKIWQASSVTTN